MRSSAVNSLPPAEDHFGISELAHKYRLSITLLRRALDGYPGVLTIEHPATPEKRAYRVVRVPASVFTRWYNSRVNPSTLPAGRKAAR